MKKLFNAINYLLLVIICSACANESGRINHGSPASDSTKIVLVDSIFIKTGDHTTSTPQNVCIAEIDDKEYFICQDENELIYFSLENGEFEREQDISNFCTQGRYSGFKYINEDSILIYNYKKKTLYLTDSASREISKWNIAEFRGIADIEPDTERPIIYKYPYVVLTGFTITGPSKMYGGDNNLAIVIDLRSNQASPKLSYPQSYWDEFYGGMLMNMFCCTQNNKGEVVMSFPIEHTIHIWAPNSDVIDTLYMGSRYTKSIKPAPVSSLDFLQDKNAGIQYYTGEDSYENIVFDQFANVYYRIATHPIAETNAGEAFVKPFSIIAMDTNGKLISETHILQDYKILSHNILTSRRGLLLQEKTLDKNTIKFRVYRLNQ